MKFGETLYQRSVPKWAAYNVKYNELKHLIKQRTSAGSSLPISIPTAGTSRWQDLEDELHPIIKREYQDVSLFLRTKQGEIDRRLAYLDKQVTAALRAVANGNNNNSRPISQARRYQKLVKDGDAIGSEIESLSRFAAAQKVAFRKILKKYRKWTGSTALQERLDKDVFSSGALQVDYADYLQRLAKSTTIIATQLQRPMLTGPESPQGRGRHGRTISQSNAKALNDLCAKGLLHFDAALDEVPYGETGGSAYFWIHPDYLEQVEALLLRHMTPQDQRPSSRQSPSSSTHDLTSGLSSVSDPTHQIVLDNIQRFLRDDSAIRPSRAAAVTRWNTGPDAVLTLASLARKSESTSTVTLKRKHVSSLLYRSQEENATTRSKDAGQVAEYLSEHRDVKPLAAIYSHRSRFSGLNNTKEIGTWAILDHSIRFDTADQAKCDVPCSQVETGEPFPHAVLHVRWEFSRLPELIRVLGTSHLLEPVRDFSLERAAVFTVNKELEQPPWRSLLGIDIRRLPSLLNKKESPGEARRDLKTAVVSNSSGPSSAGGDSVFSATQAQSSATEPEAGADSSTGGNSPTIERSTEPVKKFKLKNARKEKVRILSPPRPEPQRYWNEFDDGDSDVHEEERYAIYVDPNEETFPGAETFSKVFGGMYDSLRKGKDRVVSWWPMGLSDGAKDGERTPLLFGAPGRKGSNDASVDSSGSDTDDYVGQPSRRQKRGGLFRQPYARGRALSRKQKALERTLFQFYAGLITVAYILLAVAGILLSTGRKKRGLEVDAGVITGVVAAEACVGVSIVLICMRRQKLGPVHWGLVAVNIAVVAVVGVAELALMLGNLRG